MESLESRTNRYLRSSFFLFRILTEQFHLRQNRVQRCFQKKKIKELTRLIYSLRKIKPANRNSRLAGIKRFKLKVNF